MSQQPPSNPNQPPFNQYPGQQGQPFNPQYPSGQHSPFPQQGNYPPQQGYTQYPQGYPQQPYQQPPMMQPPPPPKKKRGKRLVIGAIVLVVALALCGVIGSALSHSGTATTTNTTTAGGTTSSATQAPTTAPTKAPTQKWTTTHTFTGNGAKKTDSFTVPTNWQLVWKCDPTSFGGNSFNLIVGVTPTDGSLGDPAAINTMCSTKNTHDVTSEHTGGTVYLDVNSEGSWTIEVQEMK